MVVMMSETKSTENAQQNDSVCYSISNNIEHKLIIIFFKSQTSIRIYQLFLEPISIFCRILSKGLVCRDQSIAFILSESALIDSNLYSLLIIHLWVTLSHIKKIVSNCFCSSSHIIVERGLIIDMILRNHTLVDRPRHFVS